MDQSLAFGVGLVRTGERVAEGEALTELLGGRVGIAGVLEDLDRTVSLTTVPGKAAAGGFRWSHEDNWDHDWFPQGITSSADRGDPETVDGRHVLCTSWYSSRASATQRGARLTFVDVTDGRPPRYRHVLLVEPVVAADGRVDVLPVAVHAGGLLWYGDHLHVAATAQGICSFRLQDLVRVAPRSGRDRLQVRRNGLVDSFGYRYLLPLRFRYEAVADPQVVGLRYSFLSVDRSTAPHHLVAGEYGRRGMTTRLVRFGLDPRSSLLQLDVNGRAHPLSLDEGGVRAMQGATVVDGRFYVTSSAGRYRRGSMWVGHPGRFRKHACVLPPGPEDLAYWPSTRHLWSLTEYPGRRYVFAMDRARLD